MKHLVICLLTSQAASLLEGGIDILGLFRFDNFTNIFGERTKWVCHVKANN